MQNLTSQEKNLTQPSECELCPNSPVFLPAIVPYALISLPINGWVMWLMSSSPVFWTDRMDVSEFHLVLAELILGSLELPALLLPLFSRTEITDILLKLSDMIITARIQFQSSICVERYFAVVHPLLYLRYKPLRYRMSFCSVIWLLTILMGLAQMSLCFREPVLMGMNTFSFVCGFVVNSFCCLSIFRALKHPSPGSGEREGSNLIKKRASNIVLIFQVTTFISYVPLITLFLLVWKLDWGILCILQPLAYSIMIWTGAVYPIFYLCRAKKNT